MTNPICCGTSTAKNGKDFAGYQRYRCQLCGKVFTTNPSAEKVGRPCIGDKPLTAAEKKRRYRERLRIKKAGEVLSEMKPKRRRKQEKL